MFSRRLPSDNYPDDFDNQAYRTYKPGLKPGLWLWLRQVFPRTMMLMIAVFLVSASFALSLQILPPLDAGIATQLPTATPVGDILGDFPPGVIQQSITIPARIDSTLPFGEKKGYRFFMRPGLTWVIRVIPDASLDPLLTLYNPDGTVVEINDDVSSSDLTSQIIFAAPTESQYAILIESASGGQTSGGYTLSILPQR